LAPRRGGRTSYVDDVAGKGREATVAMRLRCPLCGERDLREFAYRGSAKLLARPPAEAGAAAWHDYLNIRENPAGPNAELWQHAWGCRAWLHVVRDTRDHAVLEVGLAVERPR
jgi:sarcosine oxidase subunit delta